MEAMKESPKLWQMLITLIPIFFGIAVWLFSLGNKVENHDVRINGLERGQAEYRIDVNHINEKLELILIKLENKQDRKNQ